MARCQKLDLARRARTARVSFSFWRWLFLFLALSFPAWPQETGSDAERLAAAQKAFDASRWEQAAQLARGPASQPVELDYLAGLSLAKLQRWDESRAAFETGRRKAPNDPRFLVELAGVNYKENDVAAAKRDLRAALRIDPHDAYTQDFLGTVYFIEGNLEAALKYWNRTGKPRLRRVSVAPPPHVQEALLARAIGFNPPQILTRDAFLAAEARIDNLGIYPHQRLALTPAADGNYDATFHMPERNGFGDSPLEAALSMLSGVPYATVYPSFYDLGHQAVNITSLLRWDSEKRRAYGEIASPLLHDPALRLRIYVDARNENWNLSGTFFAPGAPLTDLNMRRVAAGAELIKIVNGRWSWSTGLEVANRNFRNLDGHTTAPEEQFFSDGNTLDYWVRAERSLLRVPERRFTLDASAEAHFGRDFAGNAGLFGAIRGATSARWLPRATGDDYEMLAQFRAGDTLGQVPLDELFQLGIERDNDLWLRGHAGTIDGRKGGAPLGRRFFLANWELDKNIYSNGFFTVKLGPFLDNGSIADPSGLFGSGRWLWDTGAQCKVRVLGTMTIVLTYGRDLRGGRNVFYGTVVH